MAIYSNSRLETFESCPLQFKFIYIDKIKRDQEGIEAFVGSRFHETMEFLYRDLVCKTHSLEELLTYYDNQWDKEYNDNVIITKKDRTAEDYRNLGKKCIEDYYKRYHPFNQSKVLGIERSIMIDLKGDEKYKVRGFIDRLSQAPDGTYEIHDYKTSNFMPEQKYLDQDRQLALYQIGIQQMWNDIKNVKLIWHFVAFDKEIISTRTQEQLENLKNDTIARIDKIESTTEFEAKESGLCSWCVYHDLCPKQKHIVKVENLPVNEYLNDDGVKLVNTYADISAKKKEIKIKIDELDKELEKLKEAVIQYAEKENIEVIRGSDNKLKISDKEKITFPAKSSPERKELADILRQLNKWDEVADIDALALDKIIKNGQWGDDILEQIKKFLKFDHNKQIFLSKIKDAEK